MPGCSQASRASSLPTKSASQLKLCCSLPISPLPNMPNWVLPTWFLTTALTSTFYSTTLQKPISTCRTGTEQLGVPLLLAKLRLLRCRARLPVTIQTRYWLLRVVMIPSSDHCWVSTFNFFWVRQTVIQLLLVLLRAPRACILTPRVLLTWPRTRDIVGNCTPMLMLHLFRCMSGFVAKAFKRFDNVLGYPERGLGRFEDVSERFFLTGFVYWWLSSRRRLWWTKVSYALEFTALNRNRNLNMPSGLPFLECYYMKRRQLRNLAYGLCLQFQKNSLLPYDICDSNPQVLRYYNVLN